MATPYLGISFQEDREVNTQCYYPINPKIAQDTLFSITPSYVGDMLQLQPTGRVKIGMRV